MPRPSQLKSGRSYEAELAALTKLFDERQRGQVVTYIEMQDACKLDRKTDRNIWSQVLRKVFKNLLNTRGIAVRVVYNVGYKMLTTTEQQHSQKHELSARRQLQRGCSEKALIHTDELDENQRNLQVALQIQGVKLVDQMIEQQSERASFLASPEAVNVFIRLNRNPPRATIS